jgi:hypothetical protein
MTMQYLLLIYESEAAMPARGSAEDKAMMGEYMSFTQGIVAAGKFKAGDALQPVSTATTVRVREGKALSTDGPFAETQEQLGGYYLVEATDLDDAIAIAARIPAARSGCVEIRPVVVFG